MLNNNALFANNTKTESAVIIENLMDGRYTVKSDTGTFTAYNQTNSTLLVGSIVTITNTQQGRVILSAGNMTNTISKTIVIING